MRYTLLLFISFFSIQSLYSQKLKRFTPEKTAYLNELRGYLNEENDDAEEEIALLINDFDTVWYSDEFTSEELQLWVEISNNFLRRRIKTLEDWNHFLRIGIYFEDQLAPEHHLDYLKHFEQISQTPANRIRPYLNTVYNSLYNNVLFDDGRLRYQVFGADFEYQFDKEPILRYDMIDLSAFYKGDSTMIEGTSGEFRPAQYEWQGNGGISYFTRAGLSADSAYAEFLDYKIAVNQPNFKADSVTLYTQYYMDQPVVGEWQEKLTSQGTVEGKSSFPRFISYRKDLFVPYILPYAQFRGGFSIIGSKFYGGGDDSTQASIEFNYQDTLLIRAKSTRFWLRQDKVYSEDVEAVIYLGEDSISHPKLTMRYLPKLKRVSFIRQDEGMGSALFSDTYHDLEMQFELISWEVGSPLMTIGNLNMGGSSPAVFESKNYYRNQRYEQIAGMSTASPILQLQRLSQKMGGQREFTNDDLAYHLMMDKSDAHRFAMQMAVMGFLDYSVNDRIAIIRDKVFEYQLNFRGARDYDVIQFVSRLEGGANARLSLEDYAMEINGIKSIALSDSQKVGLFPYGQKIVMHKGLNFDFDGQITAGRFNYWGREFKFNYDGFRIAMTDIDSMRFKVVSFEPNSFGQRYLVDVKTVLQDLTGDLQIDKPNNKSGRGSFSEYPIFTSAKSSYIYYDKPSIFGGVYNREDFYVTLEPFEIDSLDNISTAGLSFDGVFTSAGIFPEFDERIKVQPDYSLGFQRQTPPEGLPAYGGKGTYTAQLSLSNEGLRGDGKIDYLNSVARSQDFFFFPDSTNGQTYEYEIEAKAGGGGSNPHATVAVAALHWEPKNDVLYTSTIEEPFALYDELGMRTTGTLAHSPTGLKGKGLNEFLNAETRSKDYTFQYRKLLSPSTEFRVRANEKANWGFEIKDATADIDFDAQEGIFNLNKEGDYLTFSANAYIAYMDFARWQIPQKSIEVKRNKGIGLAELVSILPKQDSLRFMAERSKFYLENTLLESFQVPEIQVADAYIYPDTGYVAIDTNANMRTLQNASISASIVNQFHNFYGGTIDISSAHDYNGTADYEYLDQDGTPWPIRFKEIKVDTGTTVGFAQVSQEEAFYMSPYFGYYGNVRLQANQRDLFFNGYTHIVADCPAISTNWFRFKSRIDPSNILIELPEIDSEDKTKLLANGIYLASDTISGYAAFLSQEVRAVDKQMFFAQGVLYYDEEISSYVITAREKVENPNFVANILRLNNLDCSMQGVGSMSLGDGKSQMEINSYGVINYDLYTDEMVLDLSLGLNFFFSKELLEKIALAIKDQQPEGIDLGSEAFQVATNFRMEEKERKELVEEISAFGAPEKTPKELEQTLFMGQVRLKWNPESISFLNDGPIGIASLGETFVNAKLEGHFEIQRKRRGDELYLYLDMGGGDDLYIDYKRNMMGVFSSDDAIMDIIKEMDIKDRRNEVRGMPPFTYTISTRGKRNRFINRFSQF